MKRRSRTTAERVTIEDLLVKRAIEGLTVDERSELARLMRSAPVSDRDAFERTAAAIYVGQIGASARLPAALRQRIERQALEFLATKNN